MVLDLLALMAAYLAGSCQRGPATVYAASLVLALHILQAAAQVVPERGHEEAEDDDADAGVLKARERRKVVLVLATFAVALIYVAGLSPPGGFWDSPAAARGRGAGYRYRPGESLVEAHHSGHYRMFFYCNTTAFVASLFIVVLLLENKLSARSRTTTRSLALYVFLVGALVGLVAAYTAGSCRDADCSVYVVSLFGAVLAFVFLVTGLVMVPTEFLKRLRLRASTTRSASDGQSVDTIDQDQATKKVRSLVVLLANLAATITYQAGLDPPGGFWPDDGDAVLLSEHPARYKAFFYCNTAAFVASVVAIVMVQSARPVRSHTLLAVMVLDMLALVGAYAAGSCRDLVTSAVVASMAAAAVLLYVAAQVVVSFTRRAPPAGALPEKEHKRLLRETPYMPSVRLFAECIFSETRQTSTLPSVFSRYSANKKHSAKSSFTECQK